MLRRTIFKSDSPHPSIISCKQTSQILAALHRICTWFFFSYSRTKSELSLLFGIRGSFFAALVWEDSACASYNNKLRSYSQIASNPSCLVTCALFVRLPHTHSHAPNSNSPLRLWKIQQVEFKPRKFRIKHICGTYVLYTHNMYVRHTIILHTTHTYGYNIYDEYMARQEARLMFQKNSPVYMVAFFWLQTAMPLNFHTVFIYSYTLHVCRRREDTRGKFA